MHLKTFGNGCGSGVGSGVFQNSAVLNDNNWNKFLYK